MSVTDTKDANTTPSEEPRVYRRTRSAVRSREQAKRLREAKKPGGPDYHRLYGQCEPFPAKKPKS